MDQDLELQIFPKGKGRANYSAGSGRRIVITHLARRLILRPPLVLQITKTWPFQEGSMPTNRLTNIEEIQKNLELV